MEQHPSNGKRIKQRVMTHDRKKLGRACARKLVVIQVKLFFAIPAENFNVPTC